MSTAFLRTTLPEILKNGYSLEMNEATNHVGVRELRDHLSAYLTRVKHGESFVVTEHGKAIASLGPRPESTWLQEMIEAGFVKSPKQRTTRPYLPKPVKASGSVVELVLEERGRFDEIP